MGILKIKGLPFIHYGIDITSMKVTKATTAMEATKSTKAKKPLLLHFQNPIPSQMMSQVKVVRAIHPAICRFELGWTSAIEELYVEAFMRNGIQGLLDCLA